MNMARLILLYAGIVPKALSPMDSCDSLDRTPPFWQGFNTPLYCQIAAVIVPLWEYGPNDWWCSLVHIWEF